MEKMKKLVWLSVFTILVSACGQASVPVVVTSQVTQLTTVDVIRLPKVEITPLAVVMATEPTPTETPTVTIIKTPYYKFAFYCTSNPDLFMADIAFDIPIEHTFELHFGDIVYPCSIDPRYTNLMHCYGERDGENESVKLNLWDLTFQQNIASIEAQTPICSIETVTPRPFEFSCAKYTNQPDCEAQIDLCHWIQTSPTVGHCRHIYHGG
jgi:hypothetical protein